MKKLINKCPICAGELIVTELFCGGCGTTISGQFEAPASPLRRLNADQLAFILTFIRCEGKFNRMEDELKLSYPTLKNRFNEILAAMGYEEGMDSNQKTASPEYRMKILKELEKGLITPDDAERKLRGNTETEQETK